MIHIQNVRIICAMSHHPCFWDPASRSLSNLCLEQGACGRTSLWRTDPLILTECNSYMEDIAVKITCSLESWTKPRTWFLRNCICSLSRIPLQFMAKENFVVKEGLPSFNCIVSFQVHHNISEGASLYTGNQYCSTAEFCYCIGTKVYTSRGAWLGVWLLIRE